MPVFADAQALHESLRKAGLNDYARRIEASVRPVVLFVRRQEKDDTLPVGASKMAGNPDLPPGMPWPMRPALASPERHLAQLRKQIDDVRNARPPMSERDIERLLQTMRASGATEKDLELMRDALRGQTQRNPKMDASRIAWLQARMAALQTEFPLAFIAQLDLGQLSALPGFDPALPSSGVLSIFMDAIRDVDGKTPLHRVYWHDTKPAALRRREWPVELHSAGATAGPPMANPRRPGPALRWPTGYCRIPASACRITGRRPCRSTAARRSGPGFRSRTPWRHLFSYGGEYHAGARRMDTVASGDGNHFLMIRGEDLARRRFERVRDVYQST